MIEMSGRQARGTVKLIIGSFAAPVDERKIVNQLDRRGFVEKDRVTIINQDKVAAADAIEGKKRSLDEMLRRIGLSSEAAKPYAEAIERGKTLITVTTDDYRADEAANLLRQAQAERVESQVI